MPRWIKSGGGRNRPVQVTGGMNAGLAKAEAHEALIRRQIQERHQQKQAAVQTRQASDSK